MELKTKQKGNLTELQCITAFYSLGYVVSMPYGDNARYDFIADVCGNLLKIQCKTCHSKDGDNFTFECRSARANTQRSSHCLYTPDEIDYFCTFYNGVCYLIPVSECGHAKTIRLLPAKNNVHIGINKAEDYTLENQLKKYTS